jgi:hypothetical protein
MRLDGATNRVTGRPCPATGLLKPRDPGGPAPMRRETATSQSISEKARAASSPSYPGRTTLKRKLVSWLVACTSSRRNSISWPR